MPTFMMVPVSALVEPLNPQRKETLYERIDELRASIHANGLQHPIGVRDLGDGTYRIIYGHRRSIAVTQLQWSHVGAMVFADGEGDEDTLLGAENYHRTQTNDAEEARYYQRILPKYPEGTIGMARDLNVPQSRIERLLVILNGDPEVFEWMAKGEGRMAAAYEINKFKSPGYRKQALMRCINEGIGADILRRWRSDLQRQGIDQNAAESQVTWQTKQEAVPQEPLAQCIFGEHQVRLANRRVYEVCTEHWNVVLEGLELFGKLQVIKEAGNYERFAALLYESEQLLERAHGRGRQAEPT